MIHVRYGKRMNDLAENLRTLRCDILMRKVPYCSMCNSTLLLQMSNLLPRFAKPFGGERWAPATPARPSPRAPSCCQHLRDVSAATLALTLFITSSPRSKNKIINISKSILRNVVEKCFSQFIKNFSSSNVHHIMHVCFGDEQEVNTIFVTAIYDNVNARFNSRCGAQSSGATGGFLPPLLGGARDPTVLPVVHPNGLACLCWRFTK